MEKRFVVPLDGSKLAERAIPIATALANRVGGSVTLVSVNFGRLPSLEEHLDALASRIESVPCEHVVVSSLDAAGTIAGIANERADGAICMTTHGRGRLRWAVLGSVAEAVLHRSEGPVVLLGRRCGDGWPGDAHGVGVCIDGSLESEYIIEPACEWAPALGFGIEILTVIHPLDVLDAEHPETLFVPSLDLVRERGLDARTHLVRSRYPAAAIADLAESLPLAMLAMSTHARSGLERFALGSVTMGVLNMARCPVLVSPPRSPG